MKKFILSIVITVAFLQLGWSQCVVPNGPSNLFLSATDTAVSVYYDSASTVTEYLATISTTTPTLVSPVIGQSYNVGDVIGNGIVIYSGGNYVFKINGLTPGIHYYIDVFSVRRGCVGEPVYSNASLSGNITTSTVGRGIPTGYYDDAFGLTCADLKTVLFNIIKPTVANPDPTYKGILGSSQLTDGRINDDGTKFILWDQYSDNPTGPEPYEYTFGTPYQDKGTLGSNEGERYNREHSFPQAWFGGSVEPMYSDLFIVYPTDKKVNGIRANYPYGVVGNASFTSRNGTKLGNNVFSPLFTTTVFEPINEYKGDVARANLYVATAYEDKINGWQNNANANDVLNGTAYPAFDDWYIQLLYQWHIQDPVSTKEIDRNNEIYMIQGSRNPFIDHPEYVALVWQCTGLIPVTLIDFKATLYNKTATLTWYATRETNFKWFEIERSTDGSQFVKIGTVQGQNLANYSFDDSKLPASQVTYYRLKMVDIDGKFNYSKIISVRGENNRQTSTFPNPANNSINLLLPEGLRGNCTFNITDITGRILMTKKLTLPADNTLRLNVAGLPNGKYFVQMKNDQLLVNSSFIISR